MTFPCVRILVERGKLHLHGAYFGVATGVLLVRDPETGELRPRWRTSDRVPLIGPPSVAGAGSTRCRFRGSSGTDARFELEFARKRGFRTAARQNSEPVGLTGPRPMRQVEV